jgi:uncharacterized protein (DUF1499 family)
MVLGERRRGVRFYLYQSRKAIWSQRIALFCFLLFLANFLMHRFWGLPTPTAMKIFGFCVAGAVASLALGVAAMISIWREGFLGAGRALVGTMLSLMLLAIPLWSLPRLLSLPRVYDVTTDLTTPPAFQRLASIRQGPANLPEYQPMLASLQVAAYPDIKPIALPRPPVEVYSAVREVVRSLDWRVVSETPPMDGKPGVIEAIDRSMIFGFIDDVVVRVAPDEKETRIDVRSSSRFGEHDLGRNATRIRNFFSGVKTQVAQIDQAERMERVMAEREERARKKAIEDERNARAQRRAAAAAARAQSSSPSEQTRSPSWPSDAFQSRQSLSRSSVRSERRQLRRQRQRERTRAARRFWEQLGQ